MPFDAKRLSNGGTDDWFPNKKYKLEGAGSRHASGQNLIVGGKQTIFGLADRIERRVNAKKTNEGTSEYAIQRMKLKRNPDSGHYE